MAWQQLLDVVQDARAERRSDHSQAPTACPNDGEPLSEVDGKRHCPFDGWTWPDDANPFDIYA